MVGRSFGQENSRQVGSTMPGARRDLPVGRPPQGWGEEHGPGTKREHFSAQTYPTCRGRSPTTARRVSQLPSCEFAFVFFKHEELALRAGVVDPCRGVARLPRSHSVTASAQPRKTHARWSLPSMLQDAPRLWLWPYPAAVGKAGACASSRLPEACD